MKQEAFESKYKTAWRMFEDWLEDQERRKKLAALNSKLRPSDIAKRYRDICHHLSLSRARHYSPILQQRLNQLALRGHKFLYKSKGSFLRDSGRFFAFTFPNAVRRYWKFFVVSSVLFYLPLIALIIAVQYQPTLVYSILDPELASRYESMYEPDVEHVGYERGSESDFLMFGIYVYNNISIGFRTFASGVIYGVGTIFVLLFNGTFIGVIAGHLTQIGYGSTFWPFVSGHGSFELTAITIAGAAGLVLGYSLWAPGPRSRIASLKHAANEAFPLILGAASMFLIAAVIEAFWSSSSTISAQVKYTVAGFLWPFVAGYFLILGKTRGS